MVEGRNKHNMLLENPVTGYIKRNSGILIALVILCVVLTISVDTFFTFDNIISVFRQVSINAILAFGMTYVLIIGGIDLSVGSVMATSGCLAIAFIMKGGMAVPLALVLTMGFGILCGLINGLLAAFTKIPPFIITLATMKSIRGIGYILTEGKSLMSSDEVFNSLGNGYIFEVIPIPVFVVIVLVIVSSVLMGRTRFGRRMYAVGGNKEAAIYSGVNVKKVTTIVYVICGLFASIAGIILSSRVYSGQPTSGEGSEGDAIAAAVLGGTSFSGGIGTVGGTIIGALVMGVLTNGMNLLAVQFYWQFVVKGIVIILAVYIDTVKQEYDRKKSTSKNDEGFLAFLKGKFTRRGKDEGTK